MQTVKLTVLNNRGDLLLLYLLGLVSLITTLPCKRRNNVGNVAQSEKSPQNSQYKVFQNDYIPYIGYIRTLGRALCRSIEGRWKSGFDGRRLVSQVRA